MSLLKKSGANTRLISPPTDAEQADAGEQNGERRESHSSTIRLHPNAATAAPPTTRLPHAREVEADHRATVRLPAAEGAGSEANSTMRLAHPSEVSLPGGGQKLPNGAVLQGRYLVEGVLGTGGMSVVYRGRDLRFKDVVRSCAIKEMYQSAPNSQTRLLTLKNFEREASLLATLSHPAIPKVYDFFQENGKIYLIMEVIPGRNLEATLESSDQPIDELRAGNWALQICEVLEYLHGHTPEPIIFRDLKPSNIIVTPHDRIVLIDFGIARLFQGDQRRGTMIGTEGYAPPEQYRGMADQRVDIYALGATLHHLLTAVDPRLETPFTFHERPIRTLNPAVSPEMDAVVAHALDYDAKRRPASVTELKGLLQSVPGLRHNGAAPGVVSVPIVVPAHDARVVWKFACHDEVRSSPHVQDELLYVGSYDTHLYSLKAKTGQLEWKRATQAGISSSPASWDQLVVVGSEDGQLHAFDTRKGHPRWSFRTGRAIRSSPKVTERIIYVGSDDQHVYGVDGMNGRKLWQYRTWMPVRSSCAITSSAVYIGSMDGHVYSLDPMKGSLRWKQKTQHGVISTPTVVNDLVFIGSMDGHLYALEAESGVPVWRFKTGHCVNGSPALSGTRVVIGGADGFVYALEAKSGKLAWKHEVGAQITSSPRIADGSIYFGAADGAVYRLDAATGERVWKLTVGGPIVSSPAISDGIVYIGSLDHHIYALEA